jgi:RNA polymerase sigma-70 factor (ECF subfamily)
LTNIDDSIYDYLKLIQVLPKRGRFVVNLYIIEGHTHKEIAKMLNIAEGASKSQLSRMRKFLQKEILKDSEQTKKFLKQN